MNGGFRLLVLIFVLSFALDFETALGCKTVLSSIFVCVTVGFRGYLDYLSIQADVSQFLLGTCSIPVF